MKIYIITKGEYSDYRICAVATDSEKADQLAEFFSSKYEKAEVEEYDTDDAPDLTEGKIVFRVHFDKHGNVVSVEEWFKDYWDSLPFQHNRNLVVHVLANTKEAAIKIGAEKRAKFLAEKMGL